MSHNRQWRLSPLPPSLPLSLSLSLSLLDVHPFNTNKQYKHKRLHLSSPSPFLPTPIHILVYISISTLLPSFHGSDFSNMLNSMNTTLYRRTVRVNSKDSTEVPKDGCTISVHLHAIRPPQHTFLSLLPSLLI